MSIKLVGKRTVNVTFDAIDVAVIKLKTPVKTGLLRDSFTLDGDAIVNPVDYADEVEYGTMNTPGAFMIERSLKEIGERLAKRVADQIDGPGLIDPLILTIKVKV